MTTEQMLAHLRQTARGDSEIVLLLQEKVGLLERMVFTQNGTIESLNRAVDVHERCADDLQKTIASYKNITTAQAEVIARYERVFDSVRSGPTPEGGTQTLGVGDESESAT